MKILIINPNSSEIVSEVIMKSARKRARPTTELILLTNPFGTKFIDCAFGEYMSTRSYLKASLEKIKEMTPNAVVLAGFGNFGNYALKEVLNIPVVSISEATMAIASLLGHKFSMITVLNQFIPYQEDLVKLYGFENKCASCRSININVENGAREKERRLAELKEEVLKVVEEDHAEVIILAGAGLCGYEDELSAMVSLPVLDPVVVAVKVAEIMAEAGFSHSKVRKFAFPHQVIGSYL